MSNGPGISRRKVLGSSLLLGSVDLSACGAGRNSGPDVRSEDVPSCTPANGPVRLAQDYTIAASAPDASSSFMHDPGMTVLPDGAILVAAPCWSRTVQQTFMARSADGGQTWERLQTLPHSDATPFVHDGKLYMFVWPHQFADIAITASTDQGSTWSPPSVLFPATEANSLGPYWNCDTPMVFENGLLHWAVHTRGKWHGDGGVVVIAGDPTKDLLSAAAWRMSTEARRPETPVELLPPNSSSQGDWWLEPNVVSVKGKIRLMLRTVLGGYSTAGLCVVCDLDTTSDRFDLKFRQYYPIPGGQ